MLKQCITARAALAELKQAAELIPNQTMLINTIPLLEAKDSSEIENIVTTTIQQNLLTLPILYLSRTIIRHKADYYRLLLDITREHAWEPWVLFMLQAVEETACWTSQKIAAIRTLAEHTAQHVRERLPKIYSRELVDVIFEQPYCRIRNLVERQVAQRQAASRYLKELAGIGVLREIQVGKEKLFIHPQLIRLLTQDSNAFTFYPQAGIAAE
ncbi:MAG: hypothetical protein HYZ50_14515 [Deltaproteobacteria bacterium]|nr:hypothetical protein [Deltaproteobacteria bacterium]